MGIDRIIFTKNVINLLNKVISRKGNVNDKETLTRRNQKFSSKQYGAF